MARKKIKCNYNINRLERLLIPLLGFKPSYLLNVLTLVENWHDLIMFRIGLKKEFTLKLRSGSYFQINGSEDYFKFWAADGEGAQALALRLCAKNNIRIMNNQLLVLYKGRILKFHISSKKQIASHAVVLNEQFVVEQYKWLDFKNCNVIDIGANIGDSSIYFALNGAKHIYAFEPFPHSYKIALKNIESNGLSGRVTMLNEGCGASDSTIKIAEGYESNMSSGLKGFAKGKVIRILTLDSIVDRYNLQDAVLKSDCEGCEYKMILSCRLDTLRRFKQIMLEYHYGYLDIEQKLKEAGFRVKHTMPFREIGGRITGEIYATRIG